MVPQRAGDDFRGRSGSAIDQDNNREAVCNVAGFGFVMRFPISALGRDDLALFKKGIGHEDSFVEGPARIVAEVEHKAL